MKLQHIQLELETYLPKHELNSVSLKEIEKDISVSYTAFACRSKVRVTSQTEEFSESQHSQPRSLIVCMKDSQSRNRAKRNACIYTHGDIRSIQHQTQTKMYPSRTQDALFTESKYRAFYRDAVDFVLKEQGSCGLTVTQYRGLYPMFVLDVTAQEAAPANHPVNIRTVIERNAATPANIEI